MRNLRKTSVLVALAGALALGACATATPYQPAGLNGQRGGYAEQRLEANRYAVSFSGNSVTSRETVEGSLLFRAAELTVSQGYDWFSIVERQTDRDVRTYVEPDPLYRPWYGPAYPYWYPSWRYYGGGFGWRTWDPYWGRDRDIRQVDRYEATAEIVMGRGPKPAGDLNAFDAREVINNLGGRVTRPVSK